MRNLLSILIISALIIMFGCGKSATPEHNVKLAVSFPGQQWLLDSLTNDTSTEIVTLIPPGTDPENYDPAISDMKALADARIWFHTATPGFEDNLIKRAADSFSGIKTVNVARGIEIIEGTHGHSHDHDSPHGHNHSIGDPHLLTTPANALMMAQQMVSALNSLGSYSTVDSIRIANNFKKVEQKLLSLDSLLSVITLPIRGRSFVVFHPSLSYFAEKYDIEQIPLQTEGKESTPAQLRQRLDYAASHRPIALLYDPSVPKSRATEVAAQLGVKAIEINPNDYNLYDGLLFIASSLRRQADN